MLAYPWNISNFGNIKTISICLSEVHVYWSSPFLSINSDFEWLGLGEASTMD